MYLATNHAINLSGSGQIQTEQRWQVPAANATQLVPAANATQWIALFHAFRGQSNGTPHLRITAVHESE
jgi:hypothetical protein